MELERKKIAQECDEHVSRAWRSFNKQSMEIGWYGRILKAENLFSELGFADEHAYRQARGVGRSTWYRMVRIAEAFAQLPVEEFFAMSIENAEQLAAQEISAEDRHDPALLDKAKTQTADEFEETLAKHRAKQQHRAVGDLPVTWKLRLKRAQRNVIQKKLKEWQDEHGIEDEAYALEMLVAEYTERLTLVGYFAETIRRLEKTVAECQSQEGLEHLREEVRGLIDEMQEALEIVVGEADGAKAKAA